MKIEHSMFAFALSVLVLAFADSFAGTVESTTSAEETFLPLALDPEVIDKADAKRLGTQVDGPKPSAAAGQQCHSNSCKPGGCASCVDLVVHLPLTAQVLAVRCYTTAHYPDDRGLTNVPCGADVAWSFFEAPQQGTSPTNKIVRTKYFNRSHNRTRTIKFEVDYQ